MFIIKKLFKLLLLSLVLLFVAFITVSSYLWLASAEPMQQRSENEVRSHVYWLKPNKELNFNFSITRTYSIRVLSNAILEVFSLVEKPINYAIRYTLKDVNGQKLSSGIYYHAAKIVKDSTAKDVKQIIDNKETLPVASGQSFYLNHSHLNGATSITFELIVEDINMKGVVIRVHTKTPTQEYEKEQAWLKKPLSWRERAMNYLSVGPESLNAIEKANAVAFSWLKIAPQGIPNIDFESDILYETLPYNVLSYDFSELDDNFNSFYSNERLITSMRLTPKSTYYYSTDNMNYKMYWHDLKQRLPTREVFATLSNNGFYELKNLPAGLLTIHSQSNMNIAWYDNTLSPISSLNSYLYNIEQADSVEYDVSGNSDLAFEFRGPKGRKIDIGLHAQDGGIIQKYSVTLKGDFSLYDRIMTLTAHREATYKAERFYITTPKKVSYVSVSSNELVRVKLQTRKQQFNYQKRLCEAICSMENTLVNPEIAAWFNQKARNDYYFVENQKLTTVRLFESPPEPLQQTPIYKNMDLSPYLPISNNMLTKPNVLDTDKNLKEEDYQYRELTSLSELLQIQQLTPPEPVTFILIKNTIPKYQAFDISELEESKLIEIQSSKRQIFVNSGPGRTRFKTRLYFLKKNTELVLTSKHQPPSYVLKLFRIGKHRSPISLVTSVNGKRTADITTEYTLLKKRYILQALSHTEAFFLHPQNNELIEYPPATIKLNNDLVQFKGITVKADQDVWISILEQNNLAEKTIDWWQNEHF